MVFSNPSSLSPLQTDLYQLTMAQGYWKLGMSSRVAVFEHVFRENPFGGGYAIASGLDSVISFIQHYAFQPQDLEYLATLKAPDNSPLFEAPFLKALSTLKLSIDVDAIEEGRVVFPKEPLIRVKGPIWECQLLETTILNMINFQTLIATKAARVCYAAKQDAVIEFGLRRAQSLEGGLMASRAAFIGGAESTSNVFAGQQFGIPVRGTHAHSWVMAFDSEIEAFSSYAKALPNNCVFLVDTYNTLEGVQHAIEVGKQLKASGYPLFGIRLDSGDMVTLSVQVRQLLDEAGFKDTKILASSDLDEYKIEDLKKRGSRIDMWGVGTRLVTGHDQGALGGVYKLVCIQDEDKKWQPKAKYSDDPIKRTQAGIHSVRRVTANNYYVRDEIYRIENGPDSGFDFDSVFKNTGGHSGPPLLEETTETEEKEKNGEIFETLLKPIFRQGVCVYQIPSLIDSQKKCKMDLEKLPEAVKRLKSNAQYIVHYNENNQNNDKQNNNKQNSGN